MSSGKVVITFIVDGKEEEIEVEYKDPSEISPKVSELAIKYLRDKD